MKVNLIRIATLESKKISAYVCVDPRKKNAIKINDGTFGGSFTKCEVEIHCL